MFKVNIEDIVRVLNKFMTVMNYEMILAENKSADKRPINRYAVPNLTSFEMKLLDFKDDKSVKAKYVIPVDTVENEKEIVKVYLYIYILSNPEIPYCCVTDHSMFPNEATKHYMLIDEKIFCGEFDPVQDKDKCKTFGLMFESLLKSLCFNNDDKLKSTVYCGALAELVSKYLGVETDLFNFNDKHKEYRDDIYLFSQRLKDDYTVKNRYNMDCFRTDGSTSIAIKDFLNNLAFTFGYQKDDDD